MITARGWALFRPATRALACACARWRWEASRCPSSGSPVRATTLTIFMSAFRATPEFSQRRSGLRAAALRP